MLYLNNQKSVCWTFSDLLTMKVIIIIFLHLRKRVNSPCRICTLQSIIELVFRPFSLYWYELIVLQDHQLIVGIVVIADPGTVPINSRLDPPANIVHQHSKNAASKPNNLYLVKFRLCNLGLVICQLRSIAPKNLSEPRGWH